jgi:ESF2/ABP1 family protein
MPLKHTKTQGRSKKPVLEQVSSSDSEADVASSSQHSDEEMSELDENQLEESQEDEEDMELDFGEEDDMENNRQSLADLIAQAETNKLSGEVEEGGADGKNRGKGVVYISRIPPGMTHHQLRTLLSPYGEIGRIWVETPEAIAQDKTISKGKASKMARKMSKEGWVEFERAKKAYKTAKLLHCQPMGSGRFKHDLWSLKYLKDFSWNDLVNQHLHRKKMRDERLRQSLSRAKREATKFMENRNRQESIDNKKKRRREDVQEAPARPITMDEPAPSSSSSNGLLGNDLLSKLFGGSSAPPAKRSKLQ